MQSNVNSGYALSGNLIRINFRALLILISDPIVIHKIFQLKISRPIKLKTLSYQLMCTF